MSEFSINTSKELDNKQAEYYTIIGKHDFIDSEKNPRLHNDTHDACAMKLIGSTSTKFFIKTGLYGKIFNPIGMYSEGTSHKSLSKSGKKLWNFTQVNSKIFDMYITFLKTKNKAWLSNAEREMN